MFSSRMLLSLFYNVCDVFCAGICMSSGVRSPTVSPPPARRDLENITPLSATGRLAVVRGGRDMYPCRARGSRRGHSGRFVPSKLFISDRCISSCAWSVCGL
jgi:hypothetical protein